MKEIKYHKLVRDKIPDIIRAGGSECVCSVLDKEDYLRMLDEKLQEELLEYQESHDMEELADMLEVIRAVISAHGCTWEDVEKIRLSKKEKRGGFEKRILLEKVIHPE